MAENSTQPPKTIKSSPPLLHEEDYFAFEGVETARNSTINGIIVTTHR
jgi:hypothetical protein